MKAFIIALSKIKSSILTANEMISPLQSYGFDVEIYEGVPGYDAEEIIKNEKRTYYPISFKGLPLKNIPDHVNPGIMGCFYSHYNLWKKCVELNETIYIFEDDVTFIRPFYPVEFEEILIIAVGSWSKASYDELDIYKEPDEEYPIAKPYNGKCIPGAVGYGITPAGARKLVNEFDKYYVEADSAIRSIIVDIKIHSHIIGRALTKKEGKTSLTTWKDWNTYPMLLKPKAFVISLSKIESSISSAIPVVKQLKNYGFNAVLFEGTYGNTALKMFKKERRKPAVFGIKTEVDIDTNELIRQESTDKAARKTMRPGVLGCFYSHYRLWEKCVELDEPIFIFEDDVIFEREYYPVEWEDILMVCTGKMAHKHRHYSKFLYEPEGEPCALEIRNTSMPGAVGYGITPQGAKKLIEAYKIEMLPADTAMNVFVVRLQHHSHLMGRAAIEEDGKVSLTSSKIWDKK